MGIGVGGFVTKFWSWMPLATLTSVKKLVVGTTAAAVVQRPEPASSPAPSVLASGGEVVEEWLPQASGPRKASRKATAA